MNSKLSLKVNYIYNSNTYSYYTDGDNSLYCEGSSREWKWSI